MPGETQEEMEEVIGILSGGIDSDGEGDAFVSLGDVFESLLELSVALGGLDELELCRGGLVVRTEEGGEVSVSRSVDANTDADGKVDGRWWCGGSLVG
jgi:hypothetical protein